MIFIEQVFYKPVPVARTLEGLPTGFAEALSSTYNLFSFPGVRCASHRTEGIVVVANNYIGIVGQYGYKIGLQISGVKYQGFKLHITEVKTLVEIVEYR